jgi:branched-chain amino acid transport system ATP-binding protein
LDQLSRLAGLLFRGSGAGKSTLINCISGVDRAVSGRIRPEKRPIEALPAHKIDRLGVARTFQNLKL